MKYCPTCDERYDEEIIRFCTKDGTPLVDDSQPSFTTLPSEAGDETADLGEETIISRKSATPSSPGVKRKDEDLSGRIVIPTADVPERPVRARTTQAYYPPPPPPNTARTVFLTVLGTLVVVGFGAALVWMLRGDTSANLFDNSNVNVLLNQNANLNTNLGFDSNFNFDINANFNSNSIGVIDANVNTNVNARTPSPTPTPRTSPTPSPSPDDSPTPTPERSPTPRPSPVVTPTVRPPANITPAPPPRESPRPRVTNTPDSDG